MHKSKAKQSNKQNITEKIIGHLNKEGFLRILNLSLRRSFKFFEKYFKIHITPVHYYSPIPDTSELNSSVFEKVYDCTGIEFNLKKQIEYLEKIFPKYSKEYIPSVNTGLSLVDAFVLYSMVREKKPKIIIEIGAGDSTKIILKALKENKKEGIVHTFYSIEPYPWEELRHIREENFILIDKKLQEVNIDLLSSADLLFIDSSHVAKIGSDVNYEILEIVPKLKAGSTIHWHDIVIPTNYWKEWIDDGNMFWNESYMVHSFMLFNESFKIIWASRYMQLNYFAKMQQQFPYLQSNHHLMSFWIERIK